MVKDGQLFVKKHQQVNHRWLLRLQSHIAGLYFIVLLLLPHLFSNSFGHIEAAKAAQEAALATGIDKEKADSR